MGTTPSTVLVILASTVTTFQLVVVAAIRVQVLGDTHEGIDISMSLI